jgi:lysozyme family protein
MANFVDAFIRTMGHEGKYVDDPDDSGGETYRGVSRKNNPKWAGWKIIDSMKDRLDFPRCLDDNQALQSKVLQIYKKKYWNPFKGDKFSDQLIAEEVFDTGVNMGLGQAVKFLQRGLNVLNRNGSLFADIDDDGNVGSKTLGALNKYLRKDKNDYLLKTMNVLQGSHYIKIMKNKPSQEKYARGWLKRVEIKKLYVG